MKQLLGRGSIVCLCLFALIGQAIADSSGDARRDYAMARHHDSYTMFFEWIENGVSGGQFVALKFSAEALQDGTTWADCKYAVIHVNKDKRNSDLNMYYYSTDEKTIKDLSVTPTSVSFSIDTGWFEPGGLTRKLKFVATRQGLSSSTYQANAVALWKGMLDETKLIKIELKQIPSITLPFSTIGD